MWKWFIALTLLIILLVPIPVLAATSTDITVTAVGWICEAPGGLTLTYISDYEVGISWTKGEGATNTMVRAKYGSAPTSRTDGYQVYYGDGTSTSDTGVNFDETVSQVYYRAWSQNATGVWEETGVSDLIEGVSMILIALIILAMGFTITSYIFKKGMLAFAGAGAWMIAGVYCLTRSLETWDVYFSLFWLFTGLTIACAFSPLAWRETTPAGEITEEPDIRDMREEMETWNRERGQYNFLYSGKRSRRKGTRFQRTGEE